MMLQKYHRTKANSRQRVENPRDPIFTFHLIYPKPDLSVGKHWSSPIMVLAAPSGSDGGKTLVGFRPVHQEGIAMTDVYRVRQPSLQHRIVLNKRMPWVRIGAQPRVRVGLLKALVFVVELDPLPMKPHDLGLRINREEEPPEVVIARPARHIEAGEGCAQELMGSPIGLLTCR
jgi:hypothetical protein